MIAVGSGWSTLIGVALLVLGIALPLLGLRFSRPFRVGNLVQDIGIGLVLLLTGSILFFHGWRQDPLLQFGQLLLSGIVFYLVLKDVFSRSQRH